jgi:hypothetical protein
MGPKQVDAKMVQAALLRLVGDHSIEPREDWVSVRMFDAAWSSSRRYVVVIGYPAAKAALWPELDSVTGGKEGADPFAGIWVLSESQARILCERHPERN